MQVKSIAECSFIKLTFVIKAFVLSIFEWPLKTGFTVVKTLIICRLLLPIAASLYLVLHFVRIVETLTRLHGCTVL